MPDTDPIEGWIDTSTQGIAELISALESKWERAAQQAETKTREQVEMMKWIRRQTTGMGRG
jgi:hypothetical protein